MTRLFEAGFVERFRPQTLRGSYQWTYCLARDGFRAAGQTGELASGLKFVLRREAIFDYRYVIHDLRTNEWVLRYRELLGDRLLDWAGPDESRYEPSKKRRDEEHFSRSAVILGHGWYESGIDDEDFRPVQPDALLDVATGNGDVRVFVEYDRTRRVDKNYDKFRRYETLLTVWWRTTELGCPFVVFVCQDAEHRRRFIYAADYELTACLSTGTGPDREQRHTARDRTLFVLEGDIRDGNPEAMLLARAAAAPRGPRQPGQRASRRIARPRTVKSTPCRPACSLRCVPSWRSAPSGTRAPTRRRPKSSIPPVQHEEGGSTASRWTPLPRHARKIRAGQHRREAERASAGRGEAAVGTEREAGGRELGSRTEAEGRSVEVKGVGVSGRVGGVIGAEQE